MAYRLRPEESTTRGLRRLAKKELQRARDELGRATPPRDEAIHEARKRVKKVRAILELIEVDGGRAGAGCSKQLRTVNRTLSELRDADAMVSVLTTLRSKNPHVLDEHTFARIRRRLFSHKQAAIEAAEREDAWKNVDRELRSLRRAAKRWRPIHRRFGAFARGIRLNHKRGRKAMVRARKSKDAADFHEWRKQMKALWYELRLIERAGRPIRQNVAVLHRAETWLGEDHNLEVLCTELSKDVAVCGGAVDFDRLRLAADRYQCQLRDKAIEAARRIYGRKSDAYVRGIKRAWQIWQRHRAPARTRRPRRQAA
jgi:CHAD domain-containing protein